MSALDAGNQVQFFLGNVNVLTCTPENVLDLVDGNDLYFSKPLEPQEGENDGEPYVFLNFFADEGTFFNKIVFSQVEPALNAGYESDNHTVGIWEERTGTVVPPTNAVPLPSTALLAALGLTALGLTRRRKA